MKHVETKFVPKFAKSEMSQKMSLFLNTFSKCFETFQNVSPIKSLNCSKIAVDFSILISTILNPVTIVKLISKATTHLGFQTCMDYAN